MSKVNSVPVQVYLVGAGPGAPGLITVRGLNILRKADVVVYDRLGTEKLLSESRSDAELIDVGKRPGFQKMAQNQINSTLIALAKEGKSVCRLKGGDPFVFGRGGEEALALTEAGVLWEVVPGITSAISVPAFAGIPVTHRGEASLFTVATGNDPDAIDLNLLAKTEGTLVFLMARETAKRITERLIEGGMPKNTPAVMVQSGTTHLQRTVSGKLEDISELAAAANLEAPTVLTIGNSAKLHRKLDWFQSTPLFGKRVVATRARSGIGRLAEMIGGFGAEVIELPAITISPPPDTLPLDEALRRIDQYDWVTFVSPNAVIHLSERMRNLRLDGRIFYRTKIASVGDATHQAVSDRLGLISDIQPQVFTAAGMVKEFQKRKVFPKRVLHPRSSIGKDSVPDNLRSMGAIVDEVTAYENTIAEGMHDKARAVYRGKSGPPDYTLFASSSAVANLHSILAGDVRPVNAGAVVCIGPVTAKTCEDFGILPDVIADKQSLQGMVDAVVKHARQQKESNP